MPRQAHPLALAAVALLAPAAAAAAPLRDAAAFAIPARSARVVAYDMDVELDTRTHEVRGTQRITWRNDSDEAVPTLWWHLYQNAFANDHSTKALETEKDDDEDRDEDRVGRRDYWGSCTFSRLRLAGGPDLLGALDYRHPDDDDAEDRTVARVVLPEPVEPGATVTLETAFTTKLPWARDRAGFAGNSYFVAQWFPKLGVYEGVDADPASEGWNCHQYHASSEFFSDYGTYRVAITVPRALGGEEGGRVGAAGLREKEERLDDGRWRYHYVQADVHDFAWVADPDFIVLERTYRHEERRTAAVKAEERFLREEVGVPPDQLELPDVAVRLLLQPAHRGQADRYFESVFQAITWYGLWFGPYPYHVLTVVDPEADADRTAGMEYPTLIAGGARWLAPARDLDRGPESTAVHEFGHQYFYGLVGTNEFEEAWLDEGFNSYADDKVLDRGWGGSYRMTAVAHLALPWQTLLPRPKADGEWSVDGVAQLRRFGVRSGSVAEALFEDAPLTWARDVHLVDPLASRRSYEANGTKDAMDTAAWRTYDDASYAATAYRKPALLLTQWERVAGRAAFLRALRIYCSRYRFGHPDGSDFLRVLEETTGQPVEESRALLAPGILDYAVGDVRCDKVRPPVGLVPKGSDLEFVAPPKDEDDDEDDNAKPGTTGSVKGTAAKPAATWRCSVKVRQLGTLTAPVEIAVTVSGEKQPEIFTWDGKDPWHEIRILRGGKVTRVAVDPAFKLTLDANRLNNDWARDGDPLPALSWAARVLVMLQSMFLGSRALS